MDAKTATRRRRLAHLAAVIIGLSAGIPLFLVGLKGVLVIGGNDTWFTVITGISGSLMLLPLTVIGLSQPRIAGWGVVICLAVFLIGLSVYSISRPESVEFSAGGMTRLLLFFIVPFGSVARLFLYASDRSG